MSVTFRAEELDDATRNYLRTAWQNQGQGIPGVIAPISNSAPIWAFCSGIVILLCLFLCIIPWTQLEDPNRTTLLQTAFVITGGWLVIAAIRMWSATNNPNYLGYFRLIDPLYMWEVKGWAVEVTPLEGLASCTGTHHYENDVYQRTSMSMKLGNNRDVEFQIEDEPAAERLGVFCNYLISNRVEVGEGRFGSLPPVLQGLIAREVAMGNQIPDDISQLTSTVEEIPTPQRVGVPSSGLVSMLVIVAVSVIVYFALYQFNVQLHDDAIYEAVKSKDPPYLRLYLVDPRNTAHKAEIEHKLAEFYNNAMTNIEQRFPNSKLRDGVIKLLKGAKESPAPLITVAVRNTGEFAAQAEAEKEQVKLEVENYLNSSVFGRDYFADFSSIPESLPHGLIHLEFTPVGKDLLDLNWKITFRETFDDENPVVYTTRTHSEQKAISTHIRDALDLMKPQPEPPVQK